MQFRIYTEQPGRGRSGLYASSVLVLLAIAKRVNPKPNRCSEIPKPKE
jgi:hypothetical protein